MNEKLMRFVGLKNVLKSHILPLHASDRTVTVPYISTITLSLNPRQIDHNQINRKKMCLANFFFLSELCNQARLRLPFMPVPM